jgi:hypothetical protein
MRDEDMYDWDRLPLPRGDEGSWVTFQLCRRIAMCQFSKRAPGLWIFGGGQNSLKVVRIVTSAALQDLVGQALSHLEPD